MPLPIQTMATAIWAQVEAWSRAFHSPRPDNFAAHGSPEEEYVHRLNRAEEHLESTRLRHLRLWAMFTMACAIACFLAYLVLLAHSITWIWMVVPIALVIGTIPLLTQSSRDYHRTFRTMRFYESSIARLRGKWRGAGIAGEEFRQGTEGHLYAADLDLFGAGSIFELLCTARTGIGRATLAKWLLEAAPSAEVSRRQQAVAELCSQLD